MLRRDVHLQQTEQRTITYLTSDKYGLHIRGGGGGRRGGGRGEEGGGRGGEEGGGGERGERGGGGEGGGFPL